jgi:hypothetical protein
MNVQAALYSTLQGEQFTDLDIYLQCQTFPWQIVVLSL